jgi:hypothetical protein
MKFQILFIITVGLLATIVTSQSPASSRLPRVDSPDNACDWQSWNPQGVDPYAALDGNTDGLGNETTDQSFFNPGTVIFNGLVANSVTLTSNITYVNSNPGSSTITTNSSVTSPVFCSPSVPLSTLAMDPTLSQTNLGSLGTPSLAATAVEIYEWVNPNAVSASMGANTQSLTPDAALKIWSLPISATMPTGGLELEMQAWCTNNYAGAASNSTASFTWNGNIYTAACSSFYTSYNTAGTGPDLLLNSSGVLVGYVDPTTFNAVMTSSVPGWQAVLVTSTALAVSPSTAPMTTLVTMQAAVAGLPGSVVTPTGSVTFYSGSTSLGMAPLISGFASLPYTVSLPVGGPYNITAKYSGDSNYTKSTSNSAPLTVIHAPAVTMTQTSIGATVAPGQAATDGITLTPQNGFDQTMALTCSGLPSGAACTFNPASVQVNGTAATSMLTITTTAPIAMNSRGWPQNPLVPGSLLLAGIGLPIALRRRRQFAYSRHCGLLILFIIGTLAISGCGGGGGSSSAGIAGSSASSSSSSSGGSSSGGTAGTAAGTYSVTITATAGSITKSVTYVLTVS